MLLLGGLAVAAVLVLALVRRASRAQDQAEEEAMARAAAQLRPHDLVEASFAAGDRTLLFHGVLSLGMTGVGGVLTYLYFNGDGDRPLLGPALLLVGVFGVFRTYRRSRERVQVVTGELRYRRKGRVIWRCKLSDIQSLQLKDSDLHITVSSGEVHELDNVEALDQHHKLLAILETRGQLPTSAADPG